MKQYLNRGKVNRVAISAFGYTIANFLNAIVPILLLPILTTYLSKEDYGLVSLFQVMIMALIPFVGFNSQGAIEREFFNNQYNFPKYVTSGISILLITGVSVLVLVVLFDELISNLILFPSEFLWLVPVYLICHNLCEILLSIWRVKDKPLSFGLFRVGRTVLEVSLSIFFVVVIARGWIGRIEGMVIAVFIFALLSFLLLGRMKMLTFVWNSSYIKDILRFGVPLIPHTIGGVILIYSDRIFISRMVGLADTGSYTVGYQVAMAISLLQSSFNLAWVPWFYRKLTLKTFEAQRQIVKITYWYFLIIIVCALGLTIVSPIIFHVFINEVFADSLQFVFWIAIGFAFDGMYKMVVNYIFYVKKTYIISLITLFTAVLNLLLNYFLIKSYGAIGAAKATALCLFFEFLVVWWVSNRIYPMPWFTKAG